MGKLLLCDENEKKGQVSKQSVTVVLRRFEDNLVSSAELLNKRKLAIVESF